MERIINLIEDIIDDIERDPDITKTLILEELYKIKNEARILDLLHYFGKDWKNWFDTKMYTGVNNRGIITRTVKGVKYGKSNRSRQAPDETRT